LSYNDTFETFPVLDTPRLLLRKMREEDAPALAAYACDPELLRYLDGFPQTLEDCRIMIGIWNNEAYASKQFIRWGIELKKEGRLIGGIYMFAPEGDDVSGRRVDIGYEISREYWGRGYASEAIGAVARHGFTNMGMKRVQAQVPKDNAGSIRACEKAGFRNEGILRNYCHYRHGGSTLVSVAMMTCIPEDMGL
jgi:ribosomal-protein-alanine N-acetyltransferase